MLVSVTYMDDKAILVELVKLCMDTILELKSKGNKVLENFCEINFMKCNP